MVFRLRSILCNSSSEIPYHSSCTIPLRSCATHLPSLGWIRNTAVNLAGNFWFRTAGMSEIRWILENNRAHTLLSNARGLLRGATDFLLVSSISAVVSREKNRNLRSELIRIQTIVWIAIQTAWILFDLPLLKALPRSCKALNRKNASSNKFSRGLLNGSIRKERGSPWKKF